MNDLSMQDRLSQILTFLRATESLKSTLRSAHTSSGRPESVAEHTWRLCLLVMVLAPEFPEVDVHRLMKICLIHDLGRRYGEISLLRCRIPMSINLKVSGKIYWNCCHHCRNCSEVKFWNSGRNMSRPRLRKQNWPRLSINWRRCSSTPRDKILLILTMLSIWTMDENIRN